MNSRSIRRRSFLASIPLAAMAVSATSSSPGTAETAAPDAAASLVDSPPLLQNPAKTGMNVSWAVKGPATGYVEYGSTKELGQSSALGVYGLNPYDNLFLQARMDALEEGRTYYYRTVTVPTQFHNAYKIEQGEPVRSETYSFTTPSDKASVGTFAVINDTHQRTATLQRLTERLAKLGADYTIWNGDLINDYYTDEQIVTNIARPAGAAFATQKPLLFVPGNHDKRGPWARNLPRLLTPWEQDDPRDRGLGYNFAFRQGPLALIGLDTGEDKPDAHPVFGGLVQGEPYLHQQARWLERVLKSPTISSAPYIVAFCHIPIFDKRPNANGGDTLEGYAAFKRLGQQLWGPLLHKAGVQLVVAAHMHRYRHDAPEEGRCWTQIVGGGTGEEKQPATIIHATADADKLQVVVHNVNDDSVFGTFDFAPRNRIET